MAMAQVLKEEIQNRIIKYAIEEFFQKDYRTANMRDIAQKAKIPTGLIYSYFKNKETLFDAIVRPTYQSIKMLLAAEEPADNHSVKNFFNEETDFLLTLLKDQIKQFIILVDKSSGTKYENAAEDIINFTQIHIQKHMSIKLKGTNTQMDDVFFHILANSFIESIIEIARHYQGEDWARNMVRLLGIQYFYGVNGLG